MPKSPFPPLHSPVQEMKTIGPYFATRLRRNRIFTLQHLISRMRRLTRNRNEQWMRRVFANEHARQCVNPLQFDREEYPDRDYAVHPINMLAYNQVIDYARHHDVPAERIPRKIPRRRITHKYPARCTR